MSWEQEKMSQSRCNVLLFWPWPLQKIHRDRARNSDKPRGPSRLFCARLLFHLLIISIFIAFCFLACFPLPCPCLPLFSSLSHSLHCFFLHAYFPISSPIFCHSSLFFSHLISTLRVLSDEPLKWYNVQKKWKINFHLAGNICRHTNSYNFCCVHE